MLNAFKLEVPSSFETAGHVAHLNLREPLLPHMRGSFSPSMVSRLEDSFVIEANLARGGADLAARAHGDALRVISDVFDIMCALLGFGVSGSSCVHKGHCGSGQGPRRARDSWMPRLNKRVTGHQVAPAAAAPMTTAAKAVL